ncbi:hypothetical protein GCM10023350_09840 [Nocardioides endophyticus]|uniref:Uncharacterized protein n=1 Tax=Nocardioides endophyticus TaxID=1353775 RepID=A0ABP8YHI5_9ACTN
MAGLANGAGQALEMGMDEVLGDACTSAGLVLELLDGRPHPVDLPRVLDDESTGKECGQDAMGSGSGYSEVLCYLDDPQGRA